MVHILQNILSCMILPLIGIVFYVLGRRFNKGIKSGNITIYILLCVILDEGIKIILAQVKVSNNIYIKQNQYGSFLGSLLEKKFNYMHLIILNIVFLIFIYIFYKIHIKKFGKSFWSDLFFIFISSGLISSLIDKIFFGGSLDYINLNNIILVDLKDIYFFLGIILLICEVLLNENVDLLLNKN